MASYGFNKTSFTVTFNWRERRSLGRPHLSIEKSRITSVTALEFPGKANLGVRISKRPFLFGILGEFRSSNKRTLVLGNLRGGGGLNLRVLISHPSIDEIWICGTAATDLKERLENFIKVSKEI